MTPTIIRLTVLGCTAIAVATNSWGAEPNKTGSTADVVCSYAPSQSKAVVAVSGVAGGAAATTAGIGAALGLTVVTHSSGALILSGTGGYIAGTLGAAIVAPVLITVGAVVGGTAVTVELLCSPKNHPDGYKNVVDAAYEFGKRTGSWVQDAKIGIKNAGVQAATFSSVTLKSTKNMTDSLYRKVFGS